MRKFFCGGCINSFYIEDPIEPVHCPNCGAWEGVEDKGEALPRKFKVIYQWNIEAYATWEAADKAKQRGFSDHDAHCVTTIKED